MVDTAMQHILANKTTGPKASFSIFGLTLCVLDVFLLALMGTILLLQLHLQSVQKINWDEFFYLSHIYEARAGHLDDTLQMGHVYLFRWLTHITGGEMVQITIGRVVMWAVQLATLTLIVATARAFMSLTSALFAGLSFLGIGFVFIHGTSFRTDPLAALCMMYAIYIFTASELNRPDLMGLSVALALGAIVTIKVVLFAPLLAVLAIWRLRNSSDVRQKFIHFTCSAAGAVILFLTALWLHKWQLNDVQTPQNATNLTSIFETVFLSGGIFPRADIMRVGMFTGLLPTIMIFGGTLLCLWGVLKNNEDRVTYCIILAMGLPLLSFVFCRNAYPYFYAFIFPSSVLLAGYFIEKLKISSILTAALAALMTLNICLLYLGRKTQTQFEQAQTLTAIHDIFPEPVNYFDRSSMVASFPKAGIFMSSWGLRSYLLKGESVFLRELNNKTIPLVVDNSPVLSAALRGEPSGLSEKDAKALRDNYIHHWGHIWVAGKEMNITLDSSDFFILIPGVYTVETEGEVLINQQPFKAGEHVNLSRGTHKISSVGENKITLRWGNNLIRPEYQPSEKPIFGAF